MGESKWRGQPWATSSLGTGRSPGSGHTQAPQVLGRAPWVGVNSYDRNKKLWREKVGWVSHFHPLFEQ